MALRGVENKLFISEDHILLSSRVGPWDCLLSAGSMPFNKYYQSMTNCFVFEVFFVIVFSIFTHYWSGQVLN